jgi:hypothetical protein
MNDARQRSFYGSATFSSAKTMAMSNETDSLLFNFHFEVTNVAAVLTFPTDWKKDATDFDGSDWTPPATGIYELGGSWQGTYWSIKIYGPLI